MKPLEHQQFLEAFHAGHLEDAERILLVLLEQKPEDWYAFYGLGLVSRARGDFREALSRYHQALRLSTSGITAPILRACGIAHQQLGEFDEAVTAFFESLKEEPKSIQGLNSLGLTYRKMKMYHHALYYYCKAAHQCGESAFAEMRQKGFVRDVTDADGKKGLLLDGAWDGAYEQAVLDTPYITTIENIGCVFEAMGNSERTQFFFHIADTKSLVDEDLLLQIYKDAEQAAGLSPSSASDPEA